MPLTLETTIAQYIEQHRLLDPHRLQLVAVSGGADSVCLLLLLKQFGYSVEAVHCNFKLRGDESDGDELFVKHLCDKLGIALHITHFDTRTYAETHQVSIEMAARALRYRYFEQLRTDLDAESVCVAHHRDDVAETVLMNLIRGTGLRGLTGIKPRHGHIVRPLLCVSRSDIEQWLSARGQDYVTDSSNLVADVVRNKLRLKVIPELLAISPVAADSIVTTARRLGEATKVYEAATQQALADLLHAGDAMAIDDLLRYPSAESLLYEWLSPLGFLPDVIEDIARRLPTAQGGRQWQSSTHVVTVSRRRLLVSLLEPRRPTLLLPEPGYYAYDGGREHLRIEQRKGCCIDRDAQCACLDADSVAFPLTLRPVAPADRFRPFGMRGTKLVSDFLTDRHLSVVEKRRQLVLTDAHGHIVWLVGHRPDGRFCVSPGRTRQTLIIHYERR